MSASSFAVTSFLPDVELPAVGEGGAVRLRETGGKITVLVTIHSAGCAGCREYLDSLVPVSREFSDWDARLLAVAPGRADGAEALRFGKLLADERGSIAGGGASLLVADRYGQIFEAVIAGASHELPSPHETVEWLKYLGTLCPE